MSIQKPSKYPQWSTDADGNPVSVNDTTSGQPSIAEPSQQYKNSGFPFRFYPPRQWFNWLFALINNWIVWFDKDIADIKATMGLADVRTFYVDVSQAQQMSPVIVLDVSPSPGQSAKSDVVVFVRGTGNYLSTLVIAGQLDVGRRVFVSCSATVAFNFNIAVNGTQIGSGTMGKGDFAELISGVPTDAPKWYVNVTRGASNTDYALSTAVSQLNSDISSESSARAAADDLIDDSLAVHWGQILSKVSKTDSQSISGHNTFTQNIGFESASVGDVSGQTQPLVPLGNGSKAIYHVKGHIQVSGGAALEYSDPFVTYFSNPSMKVITFDSIPMDFQVVEHGGVNFTRDNATPWGTDDPFVVVVWDGTDFTVNLSSQVGASHSRIQSVGPVIYPDFYTLPVLKTTVATTSVYLDNPDVNVNSGAAMRFTLHNRLNSNVTIYGSFGWRDIGGINVVTTSANFQNIPKFELFWDGSEWYVEII